MKPEIARFLVAVMATAFLAGCASSAPPLPPSLELPIPVNDLRAVRKGDKVYLSWTVPTQTSDHQSIRRPGSTLICRGAEPGLSQCGTPVGVVPAPAATEKASSKKNATPPKKTTTVYTDTLPALPGVRPTDKITYAVDVLNQNKRSAGLSNQVRVPLLPAVPRPSDFRAEVTANGVRMNWTCPPALPQQSGDTQYRLRIYRRLEGSQTDIEAAEPNLMDCSGPPVLDPTFEWEKTYEYRAAVVTIVSEGGKPAIEIEGEDTPSVKVFAHDVFPPAVPSGLQAVFSGAGQPPFIDLVWSPDTDADLAGYNVYRHEPGGQAVKLNSEPVKTPAYRDRGVQPGKSYFYSVSAVDVRGNESARSEEANETVP